MGLIKPDSSPSLLTGDSPAGAKQQWNVFPLFCAASILGHISSVPLTLWLANPDSALGSSRSTEDGIAMIPDFLLSAGFSILVVILGFHVGKKVQLGRPILAGWGKTPVDHSEAKRAVLWGVVVGLIAGINAVLLDATLGTSLPQAAHPIPGTWMLCLASVGAAINEEILCRLGLMTILVWILATVARRREPGRVCMWLGIFLASAGFASLHLPQAIALYGKPTFPLLMLVYGGNGIPGILFGWLYWKKGIVSAMLAHFTADISIYGLLPMMGF